MGNRSIAVGRDVDTGVVILIDIEKVIEMRASRNRATDVDGGQRAYIDLARCESRWAASMFIQR